MGIIKLSNWRSLKKSIDIPKVVSRSQRVRTRGSNSPRPKYLLLDTGRNNFNLIANFRFLAIFQTLIQFRSYLCIRCTLLLGLGFRTNYIDLTLYNIIFILELKEVDSARADGKLDYMI